METRSGPARRWAPSGCAAPGRSVARPLLRRPLWGMWGGSSEGCRLGGLWGPGVLELLLHHPRTPTEPSRSGVGRPLSAVGGLLAEAFASACAILQTLLLPSSPHNRRAGCLGGPPVMPCEITFPARSRGRTPRPRPGPALGPYHSPCRTPMAGRPSSGRSLLGWPVQCHQPGRPGPTSSGPAGCRSTQTHSQAHCTTPGALPACWPPSPQLPPILR